MSFTNDQALRNLLAQYGVNPDAVDQGIGMAVEHSQQPQGFIQREAQQTYQSAQAVAPPIHVPVREVEPPVTLRGTLQFSATFRYDSIVGLPLDEVKNRIFRVMLGENDGGEWLPVVRHLDMEVWQERVKSERQPAAGSDLAFRRGLYPASDGDDPLDVGNSEHRDAVDDAAGAAESD